MKGNLSLWWYFGPILALWLAATLVSDYFPGGSCGGTCIPVGHVSPENIGEGPPGVWVSLVFFS